MKKEMTDSQKLKVVVFALKQCVDPSGTYSMDRLEHAENCIKNVSDIASKALNKIGESILNIEIEQ